MTLPRINWTNLAANLAASDPYAAVLVADGSIRTAEGEMLVARPITAAPLDRQARYASWCRRGARAMHTAPAAS